MPLPPRLRRLPRVPPPTPLAGRDIRRASTPLARLLGLAGLRTLPPDSGLLLSPTHSIHTFGMRFALDLIWLDVGGRVVRIDRNVRPRRIRACRAAKQVIELPATFSASEGDRIVDAGRDPLS